MQVNRYKVKQLYEYQPIGGGGKRLLSLDTDGVVRTLDILTNRWIAMNELPATPLIESEDMLEEDPKRIEIYILSAFSNEDQVTRICEYLASSNKRLNALKGVK